MLRRDGIAVASWRVSSCVLLKVEIVKRPGMPSIDGIRLDYFEPGRSYEVGNLVGAYLLAEGFAKPSTDEPLATPAGVLVTRPARRTNRASKAVVPSNLVREASSSRLWEHLGLAADFERRRFDRRSKRHR